MKKKYFYGILIAICLTTIGISNIQAGTTIDLTIGGLSTPTATYVARFTTADIYLGTNSPLWYYGAVYQGPNIGLWYPYTPTFSDTLPRYIVSAVVTRTINGVTKTIIASSALLTSQQYFAGHIPITAIF